MRGLMPRVVITLALAAALSKPASCQAPIDTLRSLRDIVGHLNRIGHASGESIWPGFGPDTIRYAFILPGRGSPLFNWKGTVPAGFTEVSGVHDAAWKSQAALGAASTGT